MDSKMRQPNNADRHINIHHMT